MNRTLSFAGTDEDRERFALLYKGFVIGGNHVQERAVAERLGPRSREERRISASVQRKLRALSKNGASDRNVELEEAGGTITLTQPEHELVMTFLKACPWSTQEDIEATDLMDWVMAAPEGKQTPTKASD